MKVKFKDDETLYPIDSYQFHLDRVKLVGKDIPANTTGFEIYNDNDSLIQLSPQHTVIYDQGEDYIEFSCDPTIRYVYYTVDPSTMYVKGFIISHSDDVENTVLIKKGNSKDVLAYRPTVQFFDDKMLPNYKVNENGEVVEVSDEEKESMLTAMLAAEFSSLMDVKIHELAKQCNDYITAGINYNEGHYSYTLEDQNNLTSAVDLAAKTGLEVPYHADGEPCRLYSAEDIVNIYVINQTNLTHHTTYFNQLKLYTKTLTAKEEVTAVQYGQALTGEYLETYNAMMEQSKKIIATYLGVTEEAVESILSYTPALSNI